MGEHAPPGVRAVIAQHPECFDGSGFPQGELGPKINPLARMVITATPGNSLKPSALAQNVIEYLNPRMRLSYYAQNTGSEGHVIGLRPRVTARER